MSRPNVVHPSPARRVAAAPQSRQFTVSVTGQPSASRGNQNISWTRPQPGFWPNTNPQPRAVEGTETGIVRRVTDAVRPSDIPQDVWEILNGSPDAIAHHWVPRMVLRGFTQHPEQDDPEIWVQPKSGAPRVSRIASECVIKDHNSLEDAGPLPRRSIEGVFAEIESQAAPLLRKMREGEHLNPAERMAFSNFIAAQYTRTPRSRFQQTYLAEQLMTQKMLGHLSSEREAFRERTRTLLERNEGSAPTDEAIEEFIDAQASALASGRAKLGAPHNLNAGVGLFGIPKIAPLIYAMAWAGIHATAAEPFVLGDHPVVIHDPSGAPGQPAAWLSSRDIEVTFPLASDFCLLLVHAKDADPPYQNADAARSTVNDVNMRTVAHVWRNYFGATQSIVQSARQLAKKNRTSVAALAPTSYGLIIDSRNEGEEHPFRREIFRAPPEVKVSGARQPKR
jgi:hypothetical protein